MVPVVPVVMLVLLLLLIPGTAIGKEAWAVFTYIQDSGSAANNQVFYELSRKDAEDAINKTRAACEAHAKKQGAGTYQCESAGICSEAGWSAIASYVKSGGRVGTSCSKATQEDAIAAAKSACGSVTCAKIFSYEIKREENKSRISTR